MLTLNLVFAAVAGLALGMSLFSSWLRRHWIYVPTLALLLGIAIGPVGLDWIDLRIDRPGNLGLLEAVARFTLAIALITVGLELRDFLASHRRSLAVLIGGGVILMWLASSVLVGILLGLPPLTAVLLGAILAPIDPILSAGVTTGRMARESVPRRIRHLLAAESATRHGLGLVLLLLPLTWQTYGGWEALGIWSRESLLWNGVLAVTIGAAVGSLVGWLHRWSADRLFTATTTGPLVPLLLVLALGVVSAVEAIESDGVLAVLAAGIAFAWTRTGPEVADAIQAEVDAYHHLMKQLLQLPVFVGFGAALPWAAWAGLGWRALALVAAVLLLRRIPVVLLLRAWLPEVHTRREALFAGWFGPLGVGAMFFALVVVHESGLREVWVVGSLLIAATIVVHDLSITPFSRRLVPET